MVKDMVGKTFGFLKVISRAEDRVSSGRQETMWLCECKCGNRKEVRGTSLRNGNTVSCGCYRNEASGVRMTKRAKHGFGGTRIYKIWQLMISRCEDEHNRSYKNYGARGITVCDEWHDVATFAEWAYGNGYADELTIERVDNSCGYSPDNCVWADRIVQNNHTSRNHLITYDGRTQTLAQWSRELDIPYSTLKTRLNRGGWSVERALTTSVK